MKHVPGILALAIAGLGLLVFFLLLAQSAAAAPAPLPVEASLGYGRVVIQWQAVEGAWLTCALRGTQLLGCDARRIQIGPGSVDGRMRVEAGDVIEVRAWGADGEVIARGEARAAWRMWLGMVGR